MPIVTLKPNNAKAEALLVELAPRLLPDLKDCVHAYWRAQNRHHRPHSEV